MAKEAKDLQLWNNVHGKMRVWTNVRKSGKGKNAKTWLSYSTSVGKKNESGDYSNVYFDLLFKKDHKPEDIDDIEETFEINVKQGFLTVSVYKDGTLHNAVMVMDYEFIN